MNIDYSTLFELVLDSDYIERKANVPTFIETEHAKGYNILKDKISNNLKEELKNLLTDFDDYNYEKDYIVGSKLLYLGIKLGMEIQEMLQKLN